MSERKETPAAGAGLRLIVAYKLIKAAAELVLGVSLLLLPGIGLANRLHQLAELLRDHAVETWSIAVANLLVRAATPRHLALLGAASILDGLLSLLEGWSLHRRFWWGRWLVIAATSALIPFEILRLLHRFSAGRLVVLVANLMIVSYLVRRRITRAPNHEA